MAISNSPYLSGFLGAGNELVAQQGVGGSLGTWVTGISTGTSVSGGFLVSDAQSQYVYKKRGHKIMRINEEFFVEEGVELQDPLDFLRLKIKRWLYPD